MESKFSIKKGLKLLMISLIALVYITIVIAMSFGALTVGIITVLPSEASKPSFLGYYSVCAFAPFSTLILLGISSIGFILLTKMVSFFKRKYRGSKNGLETDIILKKI